MADLSVSDVTSVDGNVAHDAADAGSPVKMGGRARTSAITAVSNDDRVDAIFTAYGAQTVHLVDATGTAMPTGQQYIEDSAITANAGQGTLLIGRRDDLMSSLTPAEGDAVGLRVDSFGHLWVAAIPVDRRLSAVTVATTGSTTLASAADLTGASHAVVRVGTSTTGAFGFEVTPDGTNWVPAEAFKTSTDVWVSGEALTPTSGDIYRVLTAGFMGLRATVSSTLGATVSMLPVLSANDVLTSAQDTMAAPHSRAVTWVTKTAQYTTTQTGAALWTPASGKRIVVTSIQIQAGGTTVGALQVWFGASGDTTYSRGTDKAIFDGEFAPSSTSKPGVVMGSGDGVIGIGATNDVLRVTDSAAINPLTITVWGYETV